MDQTQKPSVEILSPEQQPESLSPTERTIASLKSFADSLREGTPPDPETGPGFDVTDYTRDELNGALGVLIRDRPDQYDLVIPKIRTQEQDIIDSPIYRVIGVLGRICLSYVQLFTVPLARLHNKLPTDGGEDLSDEVYGSRVDWRAHTPGYHAKRIVSRVANRR